MNYKVGFLLIMVLMILLVPNVLVAENQLKKAPNFELASGDHKSISLSELKHNVIICFYEGKDTMDKNKELKNILQQYKQSLDSLSQETFIVLTVTDCSSAKWPFVGVWEKALVMESKKTGYPLYGDWKGKMRDDYHFIKNEANLMLIDKNGYIRYQSSGKINPDEYINIRNMIPSLIEETNSSNIN